jgi:hypothetical protein
MPLTVSWTLVSAFLALAVRERLSFKTSPGVGRLVG